MPVDHEDVWPPVVVEIEKSDPPTHELGIASHSVRLRQIIKRPVPVVPVEIRGVVDEVRLHQVEPAIAVEVSGGRTHARLFPAVLAISYARFHGHIGEDTIAIVSIE